MPDPGDPAALHGDPVSVEEYAALVGLPASCDPVRRAAEGLRLDAATRHALRDNPARGMQPGVIVQYDFTSAKGSAAAVSAAPSAAARPIRLVQWNIERAYQLDRIISLLRAQDADIISLQEVDVGCARSGWVDSGRVIAEALGMRYAFVPEFHELYSPMRPASAQGGGVHGNAILSRWPMQQLTAVPHVYESFAWEQRGHEKREPRLGARFTIGADVMTPQGPLRVYSLHLEVFSGILGRLRGYAEVLADSRRVLRAADKPRPHQCLLGDFNTLSHGIARCSGSYCTDLLRWRSLGYTEAEWWTREVFTRGPDDPPRLGHLDPSILPPAIADTLTNEQGCYCPFDAYSCATLRSYKGWFQGKLDFMLLSNLSCSRHWTANDDYKASDHKLLACEVTLDEPLGAAGGKGHAQGADNGLSATSAAPRRSARRSAAAVADARVVPSPAASAVAAVIPSPHRGRPLRFAPKSSARLRELMPLRRWRPGIVTSSSERPEIYLTQIAAFWAAILALAWLLWRAVDSR